MGGGRVLTAHRASQREKNASGSMPYALIFSF
jgi:hypothetical protein